MMNPSGRSSARMEFDRQLEHLQDDLLALGSMVEKATAKAVEALKTRDLAMSEQVVREDDAIDDKRREIEDRVIDLIAVQQPVASDLRLLITTIHVSMELERIGDYAEGIAKISLRMGNEPPVKPLVDIPRMAQKASAMLRDALDALVKHDTEKAYQVLADDDEVDDLYTQVYRELLVLMLQDPKIIQRGTYLLWTAHDLERIADRATNIAEEVVYLVTGKRVDPDLLSKY